MSRSLSVARNILVSLATQLVSWVLTFAVTLYLPRYVGDSGLGELTFAYSFMAIFGVFVSLGTSTVLVKEIARDRSRTGELLLGAMLLRLPLSLAATALAAASVHLLGYSDLLRTLIVVTAFGMVVGGLNDALASALRGQENFRLQSAAILVEKFLSSGLTILLILHRSPLWALAGVGIVSGTVSLFVNLAVFRVLLPTLRLPSAATMKALTVAGLPFMGYGVFNMLYGQTDPIVLKFFTNDATVGWYSASFRLVGTTLFLPTAVMSALLPTLSRLHRESEAEFRLLARRTLILIMLFGIPFALLLICIPDRLIGLMHYPVGFHHAIPVLRVGGAAVFLYYLASVVANLVIARDDQGEMLRLSIIATVIGIPACIAGSCLTQHLWQNGAIGAMASDVLLEVCLVVSYLRILPSDTFDMTCLTTVGRCAIAAVPTLVFLILMPRQGMRLGAVCLCLATYGVLCWLLRCVQPRDLSLARQLFLRKAGAGDVSP